MMEDNINVNDDFLNKDTILDDGEFLDTVNDKSYDFDDVFKSNDDDVLPFENSNQITTPEPEEVTKLDFDDIQDGVPKEVHIDHLNEEEEKEENLKTEEVKEPVEKVSQEDMPSFDSMFDSLYENVNGANNFISDLLEQKKSIEDKVNEEQRKLEAEKAEFEEYKNKELENIESAKRQCQEYIETEKQRLKNEEEQFNNNLESSLIDKKLKEEKLEIAIKKFESDKEQFENYKDLELKKLDSIKQQLESEREQFLKTKELEEKRLELESKNLSQSCARFKDLVNKFNSGIGQLPEE